MSGWLVSEAAVWSVAIVVVEPSRKGGAAVAAGGVDSCVCPAFEQRADEALGFSVCAWSAGRVRRWLTPTVRQAIALATVGRAVVGHDPLDSHVAGVEEHDRAAEKPDRGHRAFVAQHLDVGQAGGVIDADMHELIPDRAAPRAALSSGCSAAPVTPWPTPVGFGRTS